MTEALWDTEDAAEYLRVCKASIGRWVRSGKLQGYKVGSRWRFYPEDVENLLVECKVL